MGKSDRSARLASEEMVEKISVHVRTNLPVKSRPLGPRGKPVAYFSGKRFIDFLLESEFSTAKDEEEGVFETREDVINFAKRMMSLRRFYRASFGEKKIKKKDGTIKHKKIVNPVNGGYQEGMFVDEDEPFVWTYDPVTRTTIFYGLLLLGGVVMCAALPLWPNWLRNSVIGFLLFILIGRPGIWLAVYLITFSRWNLEILPHLDDDIPFGKRFEPIWSLKKSETASGNENEEDDAGGSDGEEDGDDDDNGDDDDGDDDDGDNDDDDVNDDEIDDDDDGGDDITL
eukprot:m.126279 g.126279  ORF g.126279 m.126279 type:complete len:285 (-) comp29195_c0_seq2:167-1021(-)